MSYAILRAPRGVTSGDGVLTASELPVDGTASPAGACSESPLPNGHALRNCQAPCLRSCTPARNQLYCLPFRSISHGAANRGCDGSRRAKQRRKAVSPVRTREPTSSHLEPKECPGLYQTRAPGHGMAAGLPRPEPSPAGKLDEEMKGKRRSDSAHRL